MACAGAGVAEVRVRVSSERAMRTDYQSSRRRRHEDWYHARRRRRARLLGSHAFSTTTVANDERIRDAEDSVTAHPIPLFKSVAPLRLVFAAGPCRCRGRCRRPAGDVRPGSRTRRRRARSLARPRSLHEHAGERVARHSVRERRSDTPGAPKRQGALGFCRIA